jgi:hypothetical protein
VPDGRKIPVHSLVPLKLAAELVWARVYEGRPSPGAAKEELLNSIASTLSLLTAIYEYEPASGSRGVRELSRGALEGGIFIGGAEELQFSDGRPPRRFLAIAADDISKAITALKGSALAEERAKWNE